MTVLSGEGAPVQTIMNIASLLDTSLEVVMREATGKHRRGLHVFRSHAMAVPNQIREFVLSEGVVDMVALGAGKEGMLTGSARIAGEGAPRVTARGMSLKRRRESVVAQVATLRTDLATDQRLTQPLIGASGRPRQGTRRLAQGRRRSVRLPGDER